MELILVRHGLPVRQELASGRADPELSGTGRQQAQHVADWLHSEGIDAIYTSPMRRARETAAPLATRLNCNPTVHDAIAEYDRAASHYIPMEELKREDYAAWKEFVDGGYGDDYDMATFAKTVVAGMEEIITSHPGHRVAAFCHGGVINAWASHVLDMRPSLFIDVAYGSINRFLCASTGERNIRSLNETGHLAD